MPVYDANEAHEQYRARRPDPSLGPPPQVDPDATQAMPASPGYTASVPTAPAREIDYAALGLPPGGPSGWSLSTSTDAEFTAAVDGAPAYDAAGFGAAGFGAAAGGGATAAAGAGAPAPRAAAHGIPPLQKRLLWVAGSLLAVLALLSLFFLGTRLGAAQRAAEAAASLPTPVATTPVPEPVLPATGALPPGEYEWSELRGGECVDPWVSPWEERFTVVDCAARHAAQLTARVPLAAAVDTDYPGPEAIQAQITTLCAEESVIDYAAAGAIADLQLSGAYPLTAEQWEAGERDLQCFVTRASGEPLTASVSVAAPSTG